MSNSNLSEHPPVPAASVGAAGSVTRTAENPLPTSQARSSSADQARQVRGDKTASPGERHHPLADERSPGQVEHTARSMASSAGEALADVKEETASRLHQAHDAVTQSYRSAREHALDMAHDVDDRARTLGYQIAAEAREVWATTRGFATTHALPLTVVGVGLGWLAWSVQRESRRPATDAGAPRLPGELGATQRSASRPQARSQTRAPRQSPDAYAAAMTTSGAKLMGVRPRDREIGS